MPTIQQIFGISGLSWLLTDDQGQDVRQGEVGKVDICGISRNNLITNFVSYQQQRCEQHWVMLVLPSLFVISRYCLPFFVIASPDIAPWF